MNKIIDDNLKEIEEICKINKVQYLYAFGSVCTEKFNENSDLDFIIQFQNITQDEYTDNYFNIHYKFNELFNRKIDLLTINSLSNPYFIKKIEQTKQLIYAS